MPDRHKILVRICIPPSHYAGILSFYWSKKTEFSSQNCRSSTENKIPGHTLLTPGLYIRCRQSRDRIIFGLIQISARFQTPASCLLNAVPILLPLSKK